MDRIPHPSALEAEILHQLVVHGEMYGLQLVAASKQIKRGSIYVTLGRMAEKGWITSRELKLKNEPGLPRRLFTLTGLGVRALRAYEMAGAILQGSFA